MATVLIADHDEALRQRLATQAHALGLEVVQVGGGGGGGELHAALADASFALAILGVSDQVDGGGALAWMRGRNDQRPVLMILNELKAATFAPMMRLGVCGYVLRSQAEPDVTSQLRKALRLGADGPAPTAAGARQPAAPPPATSPAAPSRPAAAETPVPAPAPAGPRPRAVADPRGPASVSSQPIAIITDARVVDWVQHARALLLGFDDASARDIVTRLQVAKVDAFTPPDPKAPLDLLQRDTRFVAVIARLGGLPPGTIEQLKNLVYSRPSLGSVIVGGAAYEHDLAEFRRLQARRVLAEPALPEALSMQTIDCLSENHLDVETVQFLERSVTELLHDSPLGVQATAPHFRVTSRLLAPIAGIIEVSGPELFGRLIVSGEPLVLTRVARHWLGEIPRTRDAVWDAAGELTNRVAGLLRAHYRARGLTSQQSPPLVIEGLDTEVSQLTRLPSIVFTFEVARPAGQIFVEWHLAAAPRRPTKAAAPPAADADEVADAGELTFL